MLNLKQLVILKYTPIDAEYKTYQYYSSSFDTYAEFICHNCGKKFQIIQ